MDQIRIRGLECYARHGVYEEEKKLGQRFLVDAVLDGKIIGQGKGRTKKAAEQQAAYQAILYLRRNTGEQG